MGIINSLKESKVSVKESVAKAQEIKAAIIESAKKCLETKLEGVDEKISNNLANLMGSDLARDVERSAYTVNAVKKESAYLAGEKAAFREATVTAGFQNLTPKLLDIVGVFYPEMIQNWIADLQPIDAEISAVFTIKPIFSNTADGVTAGEEIFRKKTDHASYASEERYLSIGTGDGTEVTFTGTFTELPLRNYGVQVLVNDEVVAEGDGMGNIAGDGVTGTINSTTGAVSVTFTTAPAASAAIVAKADVDTEINLDSNRKVEIQIKNLPVQATPHILQASYSVQSAAAAQSHLGVNIQQQAADIMGGVLKRERDQKLSDLMLANATLKPALNFSKTVPTGISRTMHYADFALNVDAARSMIQDAMTRGDVDFILAGYEATNVISAIPSFEKSDARSPVGSYLFGYLDNRTIAIIKSQDIPSTGFVIGYKGYTVGDSAVIVADWIPLYTAPELQKPNMNNEQGVASFYGVKLNNIGYWVKGGLTV